MNKKAFTLIEAIIVLAIMTMFFAISMPLFSRFMEKSKLDTTARSIVSALRTGRSYAISNNDDYYVFFDVNTTPNTYFISEDEDGSSVKEKTYKLPTGIWFYDPDGALAIGFTKGTHLTAKAACFRPAGELDETANRSVFIADGNDANAEHKKEINVERTTGRVRIED